MTLPDSLVIMGRTWSVVMRDGTDADEYGECDYDNCTLYIRRAQCYQQMADTILHEATHAIDHMMDNGMAEKQVHRIATGTLSLLRDNPALVAFLTAPNADTAA